VCLSRHRLHPLSPINLSERRRVRWGQVSPSRRMMTKLCTPWAIRLGRLLWPHITSGRVARRERASAFEAEGCRVEPCRSRQRCGVMGLPLTSAGVTTPNVRMVMRHQWFSLGRPKTNHSPAHMLSNVRWLACFRHSECLGSAGIFPSGLVFRLRGHPSRVTRRFGRSERYPSEAL
jgi:hypothetical protein